MTSRRFRWPRAVCRCATAESFLCLYFPRCPVYFDQQFVPPFPGFPVRSTGASVLRRFVARFPDAVSVAPLDIDHTCRDSAIPLSCVSHSLYPQYCPIAPDQVRLPVFALNVVTFLRSRCSFRQILHETVSIHFPSAAPMCVRYPEKSLVGLRSGALFALSSRPRNQSGPTNPRPVGHRYHLQPSSPKYPDASCPSGKPTVRCPSTSS